MDYGNTFANTGINGPLPGDPSPVTGYGATSSTSGQLQTALQQVQDAVNSGNQKQYDLALAQLMGVFNGQPTLEAQKLALDTQKLAETGREFNLGQGQDLLNTAAKLTGPKDYGDFMQQTAGGKNLYQQVLSGRPASSAPQGDMEPMDMYALLQKLGMGPGQGGAMPGPATPPPGGGGDDPNNSGDPNDPQTAMNQLYAAIMGGLTARPSGMDVGGGGTDPNSVDYSQFPTMANPGDLAYAKSGAAYDPTSYRSYMTANGYTPDTQAGVWEGADPATLAQRQAQWDQYFAPYASGYGKENTSATGLLGKLLYGGDPSRQVYVNWRNNNVDPSAGDLRNVGDALKQNFLETGQWGTLPTSFNLPGALKSQYHGDVQRVDPTLALQGWLPNYIKTLQSLGPDVNQGAAENLPLLHQLGLDNPGGLQTIKNPTGNIAPTYWDQLGSTGQSLLAQAAGKVFGWDPSDFLQQINAERPVGAAYTPGSTGVQMAPLGSL